MKQHLKSCENGHEKRAAFARSQGLQLAHLSNGNVEKYIRPLEGLKGWSGFIGRQLQHGKRTTQLLAPELDLPGAGGFIGNNVSLPTGKIAILDGQFRESRLTTFGESPIKVVQLLPEDPHRQAIRDDVMNIGDQNMFGVIKLKDGDPNQRKPRQIERLERFLGSQHLRCLLAFLLVQVVQCGEIQFYLERGMNPLEGFAILHGDGGPQAFVARNDLIEALFESD